MAESEGEEVMRESHSKNEEDGDHVEEDTAAAPADASTLDRNADPEDSGDDEPSGESLQGEGAGDDDDDSDGSGGSINEFVVGDDEDDDGDGGDEDDDGDDDAPIEVDAKLLRKKMKRRRKRFDSEIQEEADDLLATGTKKHRVRIGDEAIHGESKASKQSGQKSASGSESDDDDEIIGGKDKKFKPEKAARSIDMKYKEEEDDENQRDYNAAFSADFFGQDGDDAEVEVKQAAPRVVDPMEELESYQTAEDKIALAADIPERIFDALPPGKVTLNDMADWQRTVAPRVVACELKSVAFDLLSRNFEKSGNRHLGFEHIIKEGADPNDVFDAAVAVATHIGVHLREPPFIRRYLSCCYSSVLHHEALWYIFDRTMDATLLVKNAADTVQLMETFLDQEDPTFQHAEMLLKDSPHALSETLVFDFRHFIHIKKYNEALAAEAVSSLAASDSNFHVGMQSSEVLDFIASFTLPADLIMPCLSREQQHDVPTPQGRFLDLLEPLVSLLGKSTSEQTERVVVATASKLIAATLHLRQHVRKALKSHVYMTITVTPQGFKQSREFFCIGEHFKNQMLDQKIAAGDRFGYRDLFDGDARQCEHEPPAVNWDKAPAQPLGLYHGKTVNTEDYMPDHLAQWFRLEKQGHVQLEFKYESDPMKHGGHALSQLKNQIYEVYLDSKYDLDHEFNVIRSKILHEVFHKHLIPLVVREQKEAATARTRYYIQMLLYRSFRTKLAFPPLQPPSADSLMDPRGDLDDDQLENFRIPKIMTVCHSRAGCDPHFVISTIGADGRDPLVLDHFSHQKRRLGADAMSKLGGTQNPILRRDLELKHKLDQYMDRYGNIYAIVIGCHNSNTREMFRYLDEYMKDERHLQDSVYYFDEDVSRLIASGKSHANGEAYLVAESLARFVVDPCAEASKLFAARELPLVFRLQVHPEQGMIASAKRRDIAARVMVDYISTSKHPVSYQIFSAQPVHARLLLQFVPGLGPRKARLVSDQLCDNRNGLQTREDLKFQLDSIPVIGDVTFMNCAGFLAGSGQLSSDRDIDDVSDQLRECMDLERTHVHPIFYELALEIAQLKTQKKGAAAISAFQRERNPPVLSHQEVESIFESDASAKLVQDFRFVTDGEARELIKVVCRTMHGPDNEFLAFAPMPLHIVFEKLIGFKPHELLFMKTSAAITQREDSGDNIKLRVQDPDIDGSMFHANCEKDRHVSMMQAFNGVDVVSCVIVEVNLKFFSVGVGNRRWMMEMHNVISQPKSEPRVLTTVRSLVPQQPAKAPADTVVRPRLCSLSWFKNISVNEAKEIAKTLGANRFIACPDVAPNRISLFVCFAPGVVVQFYIEEAQWDPSKPSTIGSPLRIGSHIHCQEFDELAEVEARWIIPLIAKKNEVMSHTKYLRMTAAEAEQYLRSESMSCTTSPWALIAHEDKPGLFKFVWYCNKSSVKFCHHSFLCANNGYFVDGILQPKLSGCIRQIQALVSKR